MLNYQSFKDSELSILLRNGDNAAYTEIYNRYKGQLYVFAYKRLGDREQTKDIIHELFLCLWVNHLNINIHTTLAVYLYTAVRNRILDLIAHHQVKERYITSFQDYLAAENNNNTDHLVRHNELQQLIDQEIAALPPKMKLVFQLSRETDYTRKEIAEKLGLSEQTVKSHMHQALKILKAKLGSTIILVIF